MFFLKSDHWGRYVGARDETLSARFVSGDGFLSDLPGLYFPFIIGGEGGLKRELEDGFLHCCKPTSYRENSSLIWFIRVSSPILYVDRLFMCI